jgi:hypothetical protein
VGLDNDTVNENSWQRLLARSEWKLFRDRVEMAREEAMENLLTATTPEMVKFFQGRALALREVLELPETQLAISRHLEAQEAALGRQPTPPEDTREEEEDEHRRKPEPWFKRFAARR